MMGVLLDFIGKCNSVNLTPSEKHIDAYLNGINRIDLRNDFIKFCFYSWEKRNDQYFINRLIELC